MRPKCLVTMNSCSYEPSSVQYMWHSPLHKRYKGSVLGLIIPDFVTLDWHCRCTSLDFRLQPDLGLAAKHLRTELCNGVPAIYQDLVLRAAGGKRCPRASSGRCRVTTVVAASPAHSHSPLAAQHLLQLLQARMKQTEAVKARCLQCTAWCLLLFCLGRTLLHVPCKLPIQRCYHSNKYPVPAQLSRLASHVAVRRSSKLHCRMLASKHWSPVLMPGPRSCM